MAYKPHRSRLEKLEEQRVMRRSVLLIIITIALMGGLIFIGIPLLTKITSFFVSSDSSPVNDSIPPAPPILFLPYTATNSATISIRGRAEPNSTVYLTRNSDAIDNKKASDDGEVLFDQINLVQGKNNFVAVAMDEAGNKSQNSTSGNVTFSTTLPKLEMEKPNDGMTVQGIRPEVEVKGVTDPGNQVTLNDRFLIVSDTGSFSTIFKLSEGDNTLKLVATSNVGNTTTKEIKVSYHP